MDSITQIIPSQSGWWAVFVSGKRKKTVEYSPVFAIALGLEGDEQTLTPVVDGGPAGLISAVELDDYVGIADETQMGDDKLWIKRAAEDAAPEEEEDDEDDEDDDEDEPEGTASG